MGKGMVFARRRADVELAAFRSIAHEVALARASMGDQHGVMLSLTHPNSYRAAEPAYDAVFEIHLTNDGTDAGVPLVADPRLMSTATVEALTVDEVIITQGSMVMSGVILFACLSRLPGTNPVAFQTYWRERHAPIARSVRGIRRYVQNHAISASYTNGREPPFDGVAQTWFDDLEALHSMRRSNELADTRADEANFMASGPLPIIICEPVAL